MRPAGHKRPATARAQSSSRSKSILNTVAVADALIGDEPLPSSEAFDRVRSEVSDDRDAHHRALEIAIQQRIESRLPGRVRNLLVRSFDALVILEGQCATYYTKQLAQHAAMGVLEHEHLENGIVVSVQQ